MRQLINNSHWNLEKVSCHLCMLHRVIWSFNAYNLVCISVSVLIIYIVYSKITILYFSLESKIIEVNHCFKFVYDIRSLVIGNQGRHLGVDVGTYFEFLKSYSSGTVQEVHNKKLYNSNSIITLKSCYQKLDYGPQSYNHVRPMYNDLIFCLL